MKVERKLKVEKQLKVEKKQTVDTRGEEITTKIKLNMLKRKNKNTAHCACYCTVFFLGNRK